MIDASAGAVLVVLLLLVARLAGCGGGDFDPGEREIRLETRPEPPRLPDTLSSVAPERSVIFLEGETEFIGCPAWRVPEGWPAARTGFILTSWHGVPAVRRGRHHLVLPWVDPSTGLMTEATYRFAPPATEVDVGASVAVAEDAAWASVDVELRRRLFWRVYALGSASVPLASTAPGPGPALRLGLRVRF